MRCFGKATYYFLMMPWVIFCTLTAVFDVVAVAFFFYDLFNTLVSMAAAGNVAENIGSHAHNIKHHYK